jgi:hypothetical protein
MVWEGGVVIVSLNCCKSIYALVDSMNNRLLWKSAGAKLQGLQNMWIIVVLRGLNG